MRFSSVFFVIWFRIFCDRIVSVLGYEIGHDELYGRRYDHYHGKYSDSDLMVDVINNLGLNLLMIHNEHNDNNIAFSPYGAGVILIALGEGLQGEALYELRKAVHLPYDGHTIRVGLRDIHRHLKSYFIPREGFLAGITLNNENVSINPKYALLLRYYGYDINSFNSAIYPESHVTTQMTTMMGREETTLTVDDKLDLTTTPGIKETNTQGREETTTIISTTTVSTQVTSEEVTMINAPDIPNVTEQSVTLPTENVPTSTTSVSQSTTVITNTPEVQTTTSNIEMEPTTTSISSQSNTMTNTPDVPNVTVETVTFSTEKEPTLASSSSQSTTTSATETEMATSDPETTTNSDSENIITTQNVLETPEPDRSGTVNSTPPDDVEEEPTSTQETTVVFTSAVETIKGEAEEPTTVLATSTTQETDTQLSSVEDDVNTAVTDQDEPTTLDSFDNMESERIDFLSDGNTSSVNVTINNRSFSIPSSPRNSSSTFNITIRTSTGSPEDDSSATEIIQLRNARSLQNQSYNDFKRLSLIIDNENVTLDNLEENTDHTADIISDSESSFEEVEINHHREFVRSARSADILPHVLNSIRSNTFVDDEASSRMEIEDLIATEVEVEEEKTISPSEQTASVIHKQNNDDNYNAKIFPDTVDKAEEIMGIPNLEFQINNRIFLPDFESDTETYTVNYPSNIFRQILESANHTEEFRKVRSVEEYVRARQYDVPYFRPPKPYIPNEPPYFLVDGKYKETNIDFMTYETVLPFLYVRVLGAMALAFPLDSDKYYLLLVLPLRNDGLDELICNIRMHNIFKYIVHNLELTQVRATIPSFTLKGRIMLTNSLQKLGIKKIFEPRQADFTPMTNDKNIYVTNIEQAVSVTIKNYRDLHNGGRYENHHHNHEPVRFDVNRPFLYFVIDSELQVILMTGKVVNPLNIRIK